MKVAKRNHFPKKQFAVIGLSRLGKSLSLSLTDLGHEVIAIDEDEANVQDVIKHVTSAVVANAADEQSLRELGLRNMDVVIVSIGKDIKASILSSLILIDMGSRVWAKARNDLHGKCLEKRRDDADSL